MFVCVREEAGKQQLSLIYCLKDLVLGKTPEEVGGWLLGNLGTETLALQQFVMGGELAFLWLSCLAAWH